MARQTFVPKNFSAKSKKIIDTANGILAEYAAQGYDLSLRQLYYQFVSRDYLPNSQQSYNNLGSVISDGRLAGLIDWNMIRDRGRVTVSNSHWKSPAEILNAAAASFLTDKWSDQPNYIEVMVEKQALEGVLIPVCEEVDVRFTANKGYSSSSAMYETSKRLLKQAHSGKAVHIIYLGDHDPSGIDMSRDITDRLRLFLGIEWVKMDGARITRYIDPVVSEEVALSVHRVALNMDQVEEYSPPENPAKLTDSRATGYIAQYGYSSWELDALEPTVLAGLVRDMVLDLRDDDLWHEREEQEDGMRDALVAYAKEWEDQ